MLQPWYQKNCPVTGKRLAKLKKILYMGLRTTLNFRKFKVALIPLYRIFVSFAKSLKKSARSRWLELGQVLFCVFMDRNGVEFNKLAKTRGQYPAILTEQTWSIKDLLHGFLGNVFCGIQRVVPSGQDGSILPAWVAVR